MRRRLHLQIFRALVLTGVLCLAVTSMAVWLLRGEMTTPRLVHDVGEFIVADLPHEQAAFQRELQRRAARLHASLSVWDRDGRLIARVGKPLDPPPRSTHRKARFEHGYRSVRLELDDGRWLGVAFDDASAQLGGERLPMMVCLVLVTLLLGSYLAARRITRRLERLERGVTKLGAGDLDARVDVRGRDEIAQLAKAFNRSFDRISGLLRQQRRMLQSASHELRSPLARLRMAFELATEPSCGPDERERLRAAATRDIEELDALIDDLLLAGRMADSELPKAFVEVPLLPLVTSESERVCAGVTAEPVSVQGDARMLRSAIRNLLENARRHGKDPVRARLARSGGVAVLTIEDAGDGVPPAERERVFEAFYRPSGHREGKDGGVGLGLALVKHIAEHHGGSARCVPCASGSCFEVRLPLSPTA